MRFFFLNLERKRKENYNLELNMFSVEVLVTVKYLEKLCMSVLLKVATLLPLKWNLIILILSVFFLFFFNMLLGIRPQRLYKKKTKDTEEKNTNTK